MAKGRPRKPGERTPCGALKRIGEGLTPTAIKRIMTNLELGAHDERRFKSQVGMLLFEKKLNQREASVAFRVAEIYGRFERLHGQRRSAVSPSYMIGRGGAPELADERMTGDQIGAREKRERNIEAAFIDLQDEIASEPRDARDAFERLCVEDRPVPGRLGDVKRILGRLARKWRIPHMGSEETKPVPAKKLLSYDPKPPDRHLDPGCEIVSRAVEIIRPSREEEAMCRMMVVYAIARCGVEKEVRLAFLASGEELSSIIEKLESAEKALAGLRRIYERLAFPDRDDFDGVGMEEAERLGEFRRRLKTLADRYVPPPRHHPGDNVKLAAAAYAYCCLVAYSDKLPTLTYDGNFFQLASAIYEGATGEEDSLDHHCKVNFKRRNAGMSDPARAQYHADLRRGLREGQKDWLIKVPRTRSVSAVRSVTR
jgi:hypothetical protein